MSEQAGREANVCEWLAHAESDGQSAKAQFEVRERGIVVYDATQDTELEPA